ncbi:RNA polymerase subunit sigma [Geobacillus subterraneus]|uniref:RNA polymerase sigma factor n=2 Tax=Geobacillus TaxID=129337 RepID=A0ABM6ACG3_9BACL|nr:MULTISPECIES: FliA/WhiG family RNA polymerase sigma factor [Geobacillus]AMX84016.1 RNA polymerase subunit sigma [Geobacillus subterraneus]KZS26809.1 RNA polymerase subunit sigma [Geobacillus subterraneus]OXB88224.1 FliA/WhiG family RNA polymerase sigma factor [Geobacillus uzenensis]QIZ67349.1 FliA/WhiG family RNA polymerase sigma factor [Geobacillus subterraneus]WPZ19537.1 FliA/WhiG family RNA polymerase sigma factor [Geobacillus subterraneus]
MGSALKGKERKYWDDWVNGRDRHAAGELVERYMPLVSYHVQRISATLPSSVPREELVSYGLVGLYDALEKFDPSRDLKFDTYASFRIRGAILDGLRKEDWLPRSVRDKAKKIEEAAERLEQRYMRSVTAKEIAAELGMTEEEVQAAVNETFFSNWLSLGQTAGEEDDEPLAIRDDRVALPEEQVLKQEMIEKLAAGIEQLNEKEQLVISLFYKEELTFTEIGSLLQLSTSRISQIHAKALWKLRRFFDEER